MNDGSAGRRSSLGSRSHVARLASVVAAALTLVTLVLPSTPTTALEPVRVVQSGLGAQDVWSSTRIEWSRVAPDPGFDGSVDACVAGSVDPSYLQVQADRVNAYRWLAGVAPLSLDDSVEAMQRQQAVALVVAQGPQRPSHEPPASTPCWSALGAAGSATSNLYKVRGPEAIDGYVEDAARPLVGHRRWLLSEGQASIAIGEVVGATTSTSGHAVEVVAGHRAANSALAVAWPPAGPLPVELVPERWSLQTPRRIFTTATTVSVEVDGRPVVARDVQIGEADPEAFVSFEIDPPAAGSVVEVTVGGLDASAGVPFLRWRTGIIDGEHLDVDLSPDTAGTAFEYLLGRRPTQPEQTALTADAGSLLAGLIGTSEQVGADVDRLYRSMLGRGPDAGGRAFWIDQIVSGRQSLRDVAVAFFVSPEFVARSESGGRGVGGWIDAIYDGIHHRNADGGGRAFWIDEIAAGRRSRGRIVADFYDSPESVRRRVGTMTELLLGRAPTESELASWPASDQRAYLVAVLRSAEFAARTS